MLPLQYARRWQAASIFLLLAVFAATLLPAVWFWHDKIEIINWLASIDKWLQGLHSWCYRSGLQDNIVRSRIGELRLVCWHSGWLLRVASAWSATVPLTGSTLRRMLPV